MYFRLTSEVLESNGSSSMASICGGSIALLGKREAGVYIVNFDRSPTHLFPLTNTDTAAGEAKNGKLRFSGFTQ